jgi:hypothetical protein
VATALATVRFDFPTLNAAAEFWTRTAGHLQTERQRLDSQGVWDRLLIDLKRCFADANTDRTGRIVVDSTYLLTTVEPAPVRLTSRCDDTGSAQPTVTYTAQSSSTESQPA